MLNNYPKWYTFTPPQWHVFPPPLTVRAIYGQCFGAEEYLERFFDISFNLPHQDRQNFIKHTIESTAVSSHFRNDYVAWTFTSLLNDSNLNLRSISKTVNHLNLVAAAQGNSVSFPIRVASLLLLFRAIDAGAYQRFIEGRLADHQVTEFFKTGANIDSFSDVTIQAILECVLWSANRRIRGIGVDPEHLVNTIVAGKTDAQGHGLSFPISKLRDWAATIMGRASFEFDPIDLDSLIDSIELLSESS